MKRALQLSGHALLALSQFCVAQELAPAIYLSIEEAAKVRQSVQNLKNVVERHNRAITAWRSFNEALQTSRPELPNLRLSSDFRFVFAVNDNAFPLSPQATTLELSSEERQRAESLHQEMVEAKRRLDEAEKSWLHYKNQFLADHIPPSNAGGTRVTLPNGNSFIIPHLWNNGIAFTPDFRVAVPR